MTLKNCIKAHSSTFLQTSECVVSFVLTNVFKQASPKVVIINSLNKCLNKYKNEVENILRLIFRAFSHGLAVQKGATFGLGPNANVDTGSLLKISTESNEMMEKLDKDPINNLA